MPYNYQKGRYIHSFPVWDRWNSLFSIEKNLITFAQSRSGKGATQIIPFLLEGANLNALVVDPKGEAAEATAEKRTQRYGQKSHILDPFHTTRFAKNQLATYNPLDHIDPTSRESFRQINALTDGLILRHSAEAGHWDGGGLEVLAGFIAHVVSHPDFEGRRSLPTVRSLLTSTGETFGAIVDDMAENSACGGLAKTAANKLLNTGNEAGHFLSVATTNTKWLDDPDMVDFLSESTFKLSDLKTEKCDVFLVLPFEALEDYGRFLRLFVRMSLYHMQKKLPNGDLKGRNTFFILDEFYSLGHIEQISKSVGGMPGFNMHLWPFLQDYDQLLQLYSEKAAGTFMANCEAKFFFGVNDPDTAGYVSRAAGRVQEHELKVKPPAKPSDKVPRQYVRNPENFSFWEKLFGGEETPEFEQYRLAKIAPVAGKNFDDTPQDISAAMRLHLEARALYETRQHEQEAIYTDKMNEYAHARSCVGHPRVTDDEIMQITKKNDARGISDFALVLQDGVCWKAPLRAYFEGQQAPAKSNDALEAVLKRLETTNYEIVPKRKSS